MFAYKLQLSVTVTIFHDNLVYVVGVVDGWGFLFNFFGFPLFSQLLHSPKDFSTAMERLCERIKQNGSENGEHLCFLGSGREQEDQYMHMVVAKFLQQSVPYISVARGGFLGIKKIATACTCVHYYVNELLVNSIIEQCNGGQRERQIY